MFEEWKEITDYPNYEISNTGQVRNKKFGRTLVPRRCNGYHVVHLCKNGTKTNAKIARLVAQAFIPNPENLPCVNHRDEIRNNDHVSNLEWCTKKYNSTYGTAIQRRVATNKKQGKLNKRTARIDNSGNIIEVFVSAKAVAEHYGILYGNVKNVCNGRHKTISGMKFKYITEEEYQQHRV